MGVVLLPHEAQIKAELPWHQHLDDCRDCQESPSHELACDKAQRLHEDAVQAAHEAHEIAVRRGHEMRLANVSEVSPSHVWQRLLADPMVRRSAGAPLAGIDVSKYQSAPSFDAVKAAGYWYVIAKATEGVGYVDPTYARNWAEIHRVGVVPGSYHFSRPDLGNSPQAEAGFFLSVTGSPKGSLSGHDAESGGGSEGWCRVWKDHFEAQAGFTPGFYSYLSWIRSRGIGAGSTLDQSWLWLAWPDSNGPLPIPAPWRSVAIQQYSAGPVPGISGQCDLNRYFGSLDELRVLVGAAPGGFWMALNDEQQKELYDRVNVLWLMLGTPAGWPKDLYDRVSVIWQQVATPSGPPAELAAQVSQIQTAVNATSASIAAGHGGGPGPAIDVTALAAAIAAKLPTASDPKAVAEAVATLLAQRLEGGSAPIPSPPVPASTPVGGG